MFVKKNEDKPLEKAAAKTLPQIQLGEPLYRYGGGSIRLTPKTITTHDLLAGVADSTAHLKFLLLDGSRSMAGDLVPDVTATRAFGTSAKYWAIAFISDARLSTSYIGLLYNSIRTYTDTIVEYSLNAGVTIDGVLCKDGTITPTNGATGVFTSADGKTITVTNGIITSIV